MAVMVTVYQVAKEGDQSDGTTSATSILRF